MQQRRVVVGGLAAALITAGGNADRGSSVVVGDHTTVVGVGSVLACVRWNSRVALLSSILVFVFQPLSTVHVCTIVLRIIPISVKKGAEMSIVVKKAG